MVRSTRFELGRGRATAKTPGRADLPSRWGGKPARPAVDTGDDYPYLTSVVTRTLNESGSARSIWIGSGTSAKPPVGARSPASSRTRDLCGGPGGLFHTYAASFVR